MPLQSRTRGLAATVGELKALVQGCVDAAALPLLAPLGGEYLPWGGAAMRPGAVVTILNDILIRRRRNIVECGSGISTVWIGRMLKLKGGTVTSLEHEPAWAQVIRDLVASEGMQEHVRVVDAALTPYDGTALWYDREALAGLLTGPPIDLLVIDGPPGSLGPSARYPAVPVFRPALTADATIVLDDVNRRDERRTLRRWEQEFDLRFERRRAARIGVASGDRSYVV